MELVYMLAGGALVLAGLFVGAKITRKPEERKAESIPEAEPPMPEEDAKRAADLRKQIENMMNYNGREQKGCE